MRLRKKPVEIEGFQLTAQRMRTREGLPSWAIDALATPTVTLGSLVRSDNLWYVQTLEGSLRVSVDDWILRGVKGELYPCKPDILALTYDVLGPDKEGT